LSAEIKRRPPLLYKIADEEIVAFCGLMWIAVISAIGAFLNAEKRAPRVGNFG
jgi:hypothetical protein